MDTDELTDQLESMLASREAGLDYRVERVLKDGSRERTQVVYLLGAGGESTVRLSTRLSRRTAAWAPCIARFRRPGYQDEGLSTFLRF